MQFLAPTGVPNFKYVWVVLRTKVFLTSYLTRGIVVGIWSVLGQKKRWESSSIVKASGKRAQTFSR